MAESQQQSTSTFQTLPKTLKDWRAVHIKHWPAIYKYFYDVRKFPFYFQNKLKLKQINGLVSDSSNLNSENEYTDNESQYDSDQDHDDNHYDDNDYDLENYEYIEYENEFSLGNEKSVPFPEKEYNDLLKEVETKIKCYYR